MSLGRAQARLAAISAKESSQITKEKTKMKNKGRIKVPYRTEEGRLVHNARGKILYNDVSHVSFPWKSQQEENAEQLRACLTLPRLSAKPRVGCAGLHGAGNGSHLAGFHEMKKKHKQEKPKEKPPKVDASQLNFPTHRRTSADGVIKEIQDLKAQDKGRSANLKYNLDLNAKPQPKRKDSRAERMRALEQKIIARGKLRAEFGTDSGAGREAPTEQPSPKKAADGKRQFTVGFTVEAGDEASMDMAEDGKLASGFDSWLDDFLTRK